MNNSTLIAIALLLIFAVYMCSLPSNERFTPEVESRMVPAESSSGGKGQPLTTGEIEKLRTMISLFDFGVENMGKAGDMMLYASNSIKNGRVKSF